MGLFGGLQLSRCCFTLEGGDPAEPKKRRKPDYSIEFRAPSWLINRAWSIGAARAAYGWDIRLRSVNTIPSPSIAIRYIIDGNIEGLQGLFARREASPSDHNEHGYSLLYVCAPVFPSFWNQYY